MIKNKLNIKKIFSNKIFNVIIVTILILTLLKIFLDYRLNDSSKETFINIEEGDDLLALLYDNTFSYDKLYKTEAEIIAKKTKLKKDAKILVIGVENGRLIESLEKLGFKNITACDNKLSYLNRVRTKTPGVNIIHKACLNQSLFERFSFDIIISNHASFYIYNEDERRVILRNVKYWLKSRGYFICSIFKRDKLDPAPREYSMYYNKDENKHALTYFKDYTHDAYWTFPSDNYVYYNEKYIIENGNHKSKTHKFFIPVDSNQVLKSAKDSSLKPIEVVSLKKTAGVEDIEMGIFMNLD
jgi:SAM-dependent methyltransferase